MEVDWTLWKLFPKVLTVLLFFVTAGGALTLVQNVPKALLVFSIVPIVALSMYIYFKVIEFESGSPLEFRDLHIHDLTAAEDGREVPPKYLTDRSFVLKKSGRCRFCKECRVWKPDRCHHCSSCQKCVLKMDHHCPWFATCVGFRNQKFFVQYLIYTTIYALIVSSLTSYDLYVWFHSEKYDTEFINLHLLSLWIFSFIVMLSLIGFTAFTVYQVLKNRTTIEMYALRRYREELELYGLPTLANHQDNIFDLGSAKLNWQQIMGTTILENLLPTPQSFPDKLYQDGLLYEVDPIISQNLLESQSLQNRLLQRVTPKSSMDISLQK